MHPEFEHFVNRLEQRLFPELTSLADELRPTGSAFDMKTFSHRHAEAVHSLGLWCAAPGYEGLAEDDSRGIIINVFGFERLSVRGFVQWNRTCSTSMATIYEFTTRVYTPQSGGGVDAFFCAVPALRRALTRAFRRGRPPVYLVRCWHDFIERL